jgi:hypothetical protein
MANPTKTPNDPTAIPGDDAISPRELTLEELERASGGVNGGPPAARFSQVVTTH